MINSLEKAQESIDFVMSEAYIRAFSFVEREIKKFMMANLEFVEYNHSAGWGPSFKMSDDTTIQWADEMPNAEGVALMKFCDNFFDEYGAANEKVTISP